MKTLLRWAPAVFIMLGIFASSSIPSNRLPSFNSWEFYITNTGHAVAYASLCLAYRYGLSTMRKGVGFIAWILTILYAVSDEYHQIFVAGRNPSLMDISIDLIGAGLGLIFAYLFTKLQFKFLTLIPLLGWFHYNI